MVKSAKEKENIYPEMDNKVKFHSEKETEKGYYIDEGNNREEHEGQENIKKLPMLMKMEICIMKPKKVRDINI